MRTTSSIGRCRLGFRHSASADLFAGIQAPSTLCGYLLGAALGFK
jgi:hypothetical protein